MIFGFFPHCSLGVKLMIEVAVDGLCHTVIRVICQIIAVKHSKSPQQLKSCHEVHFSGSDYQKQRLAKSSQLQWPVLLHLLVKVVIPLS